MRITKRQLRRIIKEVKQKLSESPESIISEYEAWVRSEGHVTAAASSVIASFLHSRGIESIGLMKILGNHFGIDPEDVLREWERQQTELEFVSKRQR